MKLKLIITCLFMIWFTFFGCSYDKESPQYSLRNFQRAIKSHNIEEAMKYLDIDAVVDNHMKDFEKAKQLHMGQNSQDVIVESISSGVYKLVPPLLKSQYMAAISDPSKDKTVINDIPDAYQGFCSHCGWGVSDDNRQGKSTN